MAAKEPIVERRHLAINLAKLFVAEPDNIQALALEFERIEQTASERAWDEGYSEGYSQARHGGGFGPVNPYSLPKEPTK